MTRSPRLFFSFCFAIFLLGGCSARNDTVATAEQASFRIVPVAFDFGRVRETDGVVPFEFIIENLQQKPLEISDVICGCGCTVIDLPTKTVLPHDKVKAIGRVDITRRLGPFTNQVIVRTDAPQPIATFDICGEVIRDIWTNGQIIRVSAMEPSQTIETTFEIFTADFPDVIFATVEPNELFSVEEISRVTESNTTTIRFSLAMPSPAKSFSSNCYSRAKRQKNCPT